MYAVRHAWFGLHLARQLGLLSRLGVGFDSGSQPSGGSGGGSGGGAGSSTSGGDGGGAPAGGPSGGSPPAAGDPPSPRFTQADIDREKGAAAKEAEKAAGQKLAEALGVPLEEAKRIIAERKAAEEAKKDEATKAKEEAERAKAEAEAAKADAAKITRTAQATIALNRVGVPADRFDDALTLLLADLAADADAEAIKGAAEKLKTDKPWLFGTAAPGGVSSDPGGAPGSGGAGKVTGIEAGREAGRKAREAKQSGNPLDGFRVVGRSA